MHTISTEGYEVEECPPVTVMEAYKIELIPCPEFDPPPFDPSRDGIRDAARRHDALARRKYAEPFKRLSSDSEAKAAEAALLKPKKRR